MREIVHNGKAYPLSPLTLGALERLGDRIGAIESAGLVERVKTITDVAHESLRRRSPELTREDVSEMIDMGNMSDVFVSIVGLSGFGNSKKKTVMVES